MAFVAWHLRPDLLFTPTITTGGDTASHYYAAWWLRYELLPHGRISGWVPGSYAGFPLFQVYFPLPFVLMAVVSLVTGLPVAFKLVTVAGLVGLPLAAYAGFRLLRFDFPGPALAAVFSIPFLFNEANSVWGANIGSTLAGEFTYSLGTALLLVFAGTLHRGATSGRNWIGNGVLLAAIGLCHAYTLLVAAALGAYLVLFHPAGRRALPYLVKVGALAFGLMAFWLVPLLAFTEYTTAYSIVWPIDGFSHVFPVILWPAVAILVAGAVVAGIRRRRSQASDRRPVDHRVPYLLSLAAGGVVLYLAAWTLNVVDIRFLPFAQLTVVLVAAVPAAAAIRGATERLGRGQAAATAAVAVLVAAGTLAWSEWQATIPRAWSAWNYGGFEATPGWESYRGINEAVKRTWADPRVAYEHNAVHNDAGTVRAFESLPLFSGASTLEGLYMQSTISSPFVFYIQSEISVIGSCPLLPYHCGRLDAARAAEHLRLYNVSDVIARSERVDAVLAASPAFTRTTGVPPYSVFHVEGASGAFVEALRYEPVVLDSQDWKNDFFAWFKRPGSGEVPVLRAGSARDTGSNWTHVTALPDQIPRIPLDAPVEVTSTLAPEEIRIHTTRPGHPLLVKVSYHPRWRVEGADAVWLASPSFMLVVPTQADVRLVYDSTAVDTGSSILTGLSVLWLIVAGLWRVVPRQRKLAAHDASSQPNDAQAAPATGTSPLDACFALRRWWAPAVVVTLALGAVGARLAYTDPWVPHRDGLERFMASDYSAAEPLLLRSMAMAPSSAAAYYSSYYYALSAYRAGAWDDALARFSGFLLGYPDSEHVGEAHFRMAESFEGLHRVDDAATTYQHVIEAFPASQWAGYAATRLAAIRDGGLVALSAPRTSGARR